MRFFGGGVAFYPFLLSALAFANANIWAQDENESVGFRSSHVFESGAFGEHIDVLNGGLTLTMPIGPRFKVNSALEYGLTLSYSSKVWDSVYYQNDLVGLQFNQVVPTRKGPFGIGFRMHLGRIYRTRQYQEGATGSTHFTPLFASDWIWESPEGTPHPFFADPNVKDLDHVNVTIPEGGASGSTTPTFNGRLTTDLSYARIWGPGTQHCRQNGDNGQKDETNCFKVETPDGLVYTLSERVPCTEPPVPGIDPDFYRTYQKARADNESYCGWYTTLIEDRSTTSPYSNYVRVAYELRPNFEHLASRVYDSTWSDPQQSGRQILFHNCEWAPSPNPASGEDIVENCVEGTKTPATTGASSRFAAATYRVDLPAPGDSTSFNSAARAQYSFFYELSGVDPANDYYTNGNHSLPNCSSPQVKCTPAITDPVLKLVRIDYPQAQTGGDQYSVYYGYYNDYQTSLSPGASGDFGEVACRTLPLRRKIAGQPIPSVTRNACNEPSQNADWAIFRYQTGYYYHIKAYVRAAPGGTSPDARHSTAGCPYFQCGNGELKVGDNGGLTYSATGLTRHTVVKSMRQPAGSGPTTMWQYRRNATAYTNPSSVTVTDPSNNDTVYHFLASAPSSDPTVTGAHPDDGAAPEWSDGLNHRTEYFRGAGPTRTLVRTEMQAFDSDFTFSVRNKSNIRSKRSITQYNDDGHVEAVVERQQWDDFGHWQVTIESGFGVSVPRTTRTIYKAPLPNVYRTDMLMLNEVSDGRRVLSRLDQEYNTSGKLITSIARATTPASIGTTSPGGGTGLATTAQPGDVLTSYQYSDISGNIIRKTLSTSRADDRTYHIVYTWAPAAGACAPAWQCGGYLATKEFLPDETSPAVFKSIDRDRDANSGLIIATRDTAQIETRYTYDRLGRLKRITPPNAEEETFIDYVSLRETTARQGTYTSDLDAEANFLLNRYLYDGLGRLVVTKKRPADPAEGYACEKTQYDSQGRIVYKTEAMYRTETASGTFCNALPEVPAGQCWAHFDSTATRADNPGTESDYRVRGTSQCDPFGRVQRQIPVMDPTLPPDIGIIDSRYFGTSSEVTVHGIRDSLETWNDSTTVNLRDAFGRLVVVDTKAGGHCAETGYPCSPGAFPCSGGAACLVTSSEGADAFYEYDAADRLVHVRLSDNYTQNQVRRFGYDGLGQLVWQEHPENGTTVIKRYDALGNAGEVQYAKGNAVRTTYDFVGRVATVDRAMAASSIVTTTLHYYDMNDATSPHGLGKPYGIDMWEMTAGGPLRQVLTQYQLYAEPGGRLSTLRHSFVDWAANVIVDTDYTYNSFGQLDTLTYPRPASGGHTPLTVKYAYRNGFVVCASASGGECGESDPVWLGKVKYNPAGGVIGVDMRGGGRTEITTDERNRPRTITAGNVDNWAAAPYAEGPYRYDGAGNIYEIDRPEAGSAHRFGYDAMNRLVTAHTEYGQIIDQTFTYDVFGNMTHRVLETLGMGREIDAFSLAAPVSNRVASRTTTYESGLNSTQAPTVPFIYDPNGNLRQGGRLRIDSGNVVEDVRHQFDYDTADRLVRVHQIGSAGLTELDRFAYDANGHRIVRTVKGGQTTFSVRDSAGQVLSEFRMTTPHGAATEREWAADYVYLAGRLLGMRENLKPQPPNRLTASQVKTPTGCTLNCKWLVTLSWTPSPEPDVVSYEILRQPNGTGGFQPYGSSSTATFSDTIQYNSNVIVDYQIIAVDEQELRSGPSPSLRVKTGDTAGPTAPTLAATPFDSSVWLSWTGGSDASGIIGYEICRHLTSSSPCDPLNATLIRTLTYHDINLVNGQTYYYRVRGRDSNLTWGAHSTEKTATPIDRTPPAPPKDVAAASTCGSTGDPEVVDLVWEANVAVAPYTLHYSVYRNTTPLFEGIGVTPTLVGTTTLANLRDEGPLTPGMNYYYAVKASHYSGDQLVTTSAYSPIVAATPRDTSIIPQGRLVAEAEDGRVRLRWQPPTGAPQGEYKIYRKPNAESDCTNYVQVAQGTYAQITSQGGLIDSGVPNNLAYDYTLVRVGANNAESSFATPTLAIPLDRPEGFSQCRMAADPLCTTDCGSGHTLAINWFPPAARFYQPYLATTSDGTYAYLKGYHLYHHKTCKVRYSIDDAQGTTTYLIDDSPTRPVVVNENDAVDRYLINKNLTSGDTLREDLLDPRFTISGATKLSSPDGSATDPAYYRGCSVAQAGLPILESCAMPRAVYKVFAEGSWLTRESDWPDYFDYDQPDERLRCGKTLGDPYGMFASDYPPALSNRDTGNGFTLAAGNTVTYWIEERKRDSTGNYILSRNTTTKTVTLTGTGDTVKPRITRPPLKNVNDATHWALYATATNGVFPDGAQIEEKAAGLDTIDDTRVTSNPGIPEGPLYGVTSPITACREAGDFYSTMARPVSKVTATTLGPGSVRLDWSPPIIPPGEPRLAGYYVYARRQNDRRTFSSPLPYASRGAQEPWLIITGIEGASSSAPDVFTIKAFDDAGRVSGPTYLCDTSGVSCSEYDICPLQRCNVSRMECNSTATPTGCPTGDVCQVEACEEAGGRWCTHDQTMGCSVSSDCGAGFCDGHCSTSGAACNPDSSHCTATFPPCPADEVCKPGAYCKSYGNSVTVETPSNGGVPSSVRTVLWTLNDATGIGRGRNGIKLAWNPGGEGAAQGYRIYRATSEDGPYCILLQGEGGGVCGSDVVGRTVAMDAFSTEYSATGLSYWDQTVQPERVYYYGISRVDNGVESPWSVIVAGQALPFDVDTPPPPQGLRAWAPHNGSLEDRRGVRLSWCPIGLPSAGSADAASFPAPTEYRIYRKHINAFSPDYRLIARVLPDCLDAQERCVIAATCPSNDPETCMEIVGPVSPGTCGGQSQPLCGIIDHTFTRWPSAYPYNQPDFNFRYFVTAVKRAGPGDEFESMPSNLNDAWLNYCALGYLNFEDPNPDTCEARRDPDGDAQFSVCGDENAGFGLDGGDRDPIHVAAGNRDVAIDFSGAFAMGSGSSPLAPYRIIGQTEPPETRFVFYHLDHLGSPRLILDDTGEIVSEHHYLPFGEERPTPDDSTLSRRAFTGHERDSESGLDYMLARYYASSLARFMAVDPGDDTVLEDPQSWNKYAYVGNNPIKYLDPNGKFRIIGSHSHQNISRAATTQPSHVRQRDVIKGNKGQDSLSKRINNANDKDHLREGGPTGSATDSRVVAGVAALGSALTSLASGNVGAAGQALGASHHSMQDLVGHGGVTGDQHDAQNVDSSRSAGFSIREAGATDLTSTINGIFNDAAAAIQAGGDVDTIVSGAQAAATGAARKAYNDTKAKLDAAGKKPEGY